MKSSYLRLAMSVAALYGPAPMAAAAEDAGEAPDGAEIIVTAQKREQRLIDVPIAISVQNADALRDRRVTNTFDALRQVPGVSGANPSDELTQVSIRGISTADYGIGSDPAIGVFFDGVYLGRAENSTTNFIDLERVEVARGPQGEVFGRATPGGAISLVPRRPGPDHELEAMLEGGNIGTIRGSLIANTRLADNLFLRGSILYDRHGNFIDNLALGDRLGGEEGLTGRMALRYQPGDATTIDLTGWYEKFDGDPWLYRNFVETVPGGEAVPDKLAFTRDIVSELPASQQVESRKTWGVVLRGEHEFGSGYRIVSTSSALGYDADYLDDFDGTDLFLFQYGQYTGQSLLTQELRFQSPASAPVRWFAGALAYREDVDTTVIQSYGDFDLCVFYEFGDENDCAPAGNGVTDTFIYADGKNKGFALYAEAEADLGRKFTLTAGLRYTRDSKRIVVNAPTPGGFLPADDVGYTVPTDGLDVLRGQSFTSVQPRIALTYKPNPDLSIYALFAEGEKPGGFDTFNAFSPQFSSENVRNYEAGIKGKAFDGHLTFALTAYAFDYTDLQVIVSDGPRDLVKNAASARGRGAEFEASYHASWGELGLRSSINDTHFEAFTNGAADHSGKRLPYTPKFTLGATVSLVQPVGGGWEAFGRVDADYQARQFLTPDNNDFASQPGHANIDFRLGLRRDNMEIYAFGQNVTDTRIVGYGEATDYNVNFGAYLGQPSMPAVFGIGCRVKM